MFCQGWGALHWWVVERKGILTCRNFFVPPAHRTKHNDFHVNEHWSQCPSLMHLSRLCSENLDSYMMPLAKGTILAGTTYSHIFLKRRVHVRSGVVPISAHTYEHLRRYMGVFAYTSNVVPNIFCIDSQKISADAQKALGADGYWSRQIINSKPISIQSKDNCID